MQVDSVGRMFKLIQVFWIFNCEWIQMSSVILWIYDSNIQVKEMTMQVASAVG